MTVSAEPKANILLVDDRRENLLVLEVTLEELGQNLVSATSGQQALRHLLDSDFAVVLLDIQMEDLDGFETAHLIRAQERSRHTPIIFMTAYENDRFPPEKAYALGAVDYLLKPIVPDILRAKVAGFVELFQKTEQVKRQAERLRQMERRDFERRLDEEKLRLAEERYRETSRLNAELERRVRERTLDLEAANRELQREVAEHQRTAEELRRSNRELEQFAYVASHDLREPLRKVRIYLQLLQERYRGRLDEKADRFIAYAVDSAGRMQALVNDLLAFARVGSRGNPARPTDSAAACDQALANLEPAIRESGAVVTRTALPLVRGDAGQLVQLFQNLLGNAVKFRAEKSPAVQVTAERRGSAWRFAVRDNGIGIDPQYRDRLFVLFQRLHSSREYPGTGIGLAICKKIVERHGGEIGVESEPGQGATFWFTLPALEDQQP
ncbi:MAG: sensor histidine kinase [Terriglobales bacterium]